MKPKSYNELIREGISPEQIIEEAIISTKQGIKYNFQNQLPRLQLLHENENKEFYVLSDNEFVKVSIDKTKLDSKLPVQSFYTSTDELSKLIEDSMNDEKTIGFVPVTDLTKKLLTEKFDMKIFSQGTINKNMGYLSFDLYNRH